MKSNQTRQPGWFKQGKCLTRWKHTKSVSLLQDKMWIKQSTSCLLLFSFFTKLLPEGQVDGLFYVAVLQDIPIKMFKGCDSNFEVKCSK